MSFSFIVSLFLSILLVIGTKLNYTSYISSILYKITNPIISPITAIRQARENLFTTLLNLPKTNSDNLKLKKENDELKIKNKLLTNLISDQDQIKQLNNANQWQVQPITLVSIDSLSIFTSLNFDNIKPGQPVATGNSLVGLVKSVEKPIIKVIPLNHPEIKLSVQLESGSKGNLVFSQNETLINNIDSNTSFDSNMLVLSLPSAQVPENLIIGRIDKIKSNKASPTQELSISLDQEITKAKDFYVITQP